MPDLLIRSGTPRDLPAIAALQSRAPEASQWPPADYLRYYFRVAEREGVLAGFSVARQAGGESELLNLVVGPEFRRQGVGRALLADLLNHVGQPLYLEVRESNHTARRFYKALCFEQVGYRYGYYTDPPEGAVVMKFHSC